MSGYVEQIEQRSPQIIKEYRSRLTEKVQELLESTQIDENKILAETAIFADKICTDEEIVHPSVRV